MLLLNLEIEKAIELYDLQWFYACFVYFKVAFKTYLY